MFKIILLGWVGGIALMGIDFPLIMQYEKVGEALLNRTGFVGDFFI